MPTSTTQREDAAGPPTTFSRRSKWHAARNRALRSGDWTRATDAPWTYRAALLLKARVRTGHGQWRPRGSWDAAVTPANETETRFHVQIRPLSGGRPTTPDQRT